MIHDNELSQEEMSDLRDFVAEGMKEFSNLMEILDDVFLSEEKRELIMTSCYLLTQNYKEIAGLLFSMENEASPHN